MEWLKRNGSLALGIGLPVLLIMFFLLAAWLPKLWSDPPKYDLLYLANYNDYGALHYHIENGYVLFELLDANPRIGYNSAKLYRYSASKDSVTEITLSVPQQNPQSYNAQPSTTNGSKIIPISIPELENVHVDTSSKSPDGYEFRFDSTSSPGLIGDLFFSSSGHYGAALVKGGNIIRIPNTDNTSCCYGNIKFIGWVVP